MEKTIHQLHEAKVNNNCPECFSTEGLKFSFSQEEIENKFYSKAKSDIIETLVCEKCNEQIYPVNWNEDIERVYAYHKKLAKPMSTTLKLKPIAYFILLADALLIGWAIYYFSSN